MRSLCELALRCVERLTVVTGQPRRLAQGMFRAAGSITLTTRRKGGMLMTNQGRQCKGARQGVWLACGGVVLAAALLMTVLPGQAAACSLFQADLKGALLPAVSEVRDDFALPPILLEFARLDGLMLIRFLQLLPWPDASAPLEVHS